MQIPPLRERGGGALHPDSRTPKNASGHEREQEKKKGKRKSDAVFAASAGGGRGGAPVPVRLVREGGDKGDENTFGCEL